MTLSFSAWFAGVKLINFFQIQTGFCILAIDATFHYCRERQHDQRFQQVHHRFCMSKDDKKLFTITPTAPANRHCVFLKRQPLFTGLATVSKWEIYCLQLRKSADKIRKNTADGISCGLLCKGRF